MTLAGYRQHLDLRITPYFGTWKLRSLTTEDVEGFKAHLAEQGVSAATAGKYLLTLKMLLKTAVVWGYLQANPAEYVKRPRHTRPEMSILTPRELERLIQATDARYRCLMMCAAYTGMRQGELLALQWPDVEFASNRIFVCRTLQRGNFYEPKSASSRRNVSIPAPLVEALKEHQLRQAVELEQNELELVFPNDNGEPLSASTVIHRVFEPALKRAELRRVRFHDLRHSFASALVSSGQNIKWIQKQLGHSSIQITMDVYSHLLPEVERDAPAKIEAALIPLKELVG